MQVQCVACNVYRYGEQNRFGIYLGSEKSEELLEESRKIVKFTDQDLIEMIEYFSDKVSELN